MSVKKSDYFGKFLDTLSDRGSSAPESASSEASNSRAQTQSRQGKPPTDLVERSISLLSTGPKSLKDLIVVGDSFSAVLAALQQLQEIGYVERAEGDTYQLTDKGQEIAQVIARSVK